MPSRFVEVPASAIRQRVAEAGFRLIPSNRGGEEIYQRAHDRDPRYVVKIYSSISRGASGARECGSDAIRVVALLLADGRAYPIFKAKRVYRTGSVEAVLNRMMERARSAYAACNQHRKRAS